MKTVHVFIVNTETFQYHLEYLFAGTGSGNDHIDFNSKGATSLRINTENKLVNMISDAQRIRRGDGVVFYLQQDSQRGVPEGKFFGIFEAINDLSYLDNNDNEQFLRKQLGKSLTFRTLLSPRNVYPRGVTEWEALDEIRYIQSPNQMLWSLIYRKLRALRGNSMITIYESERLFKLIRDKNNRQTISGIGFTFNIHTQEIEPLQSPRVYSGRKTEIDILPRLLAKAENRQSFESHLQAYIVQNIGRSINASLDNCLLQNLSIEWIGNEVACGVGMQRIDVMLSLVGDNDYRTVVPIELKTGLAEAKNISQIQRYIDWLEQYYIPNRVSDIQPVLIAKKPYRRTTAKYQKFIKSLRDFNQRNSCFPIKYIELEVTNSALQFTAISY